MPVSHREETAIVYIPWTRTELRNLTKDFPTLSRTDRFAMEFDLTVITYDTCYSNLFQLIHLLVSEK